MWARIKKWFAGPIIYNADNPEAYDPFMDLLYRFRQMQAENADLRARIKELEKDLKANSGQLVARNNALANLSAERDALRSTLSVYEEDDCA